MASAQGNISRRTFVQRLGYGVVLGGLLCQAPAAFALASSKLASRQGAAPLWLHYNENSLGMSPQAVQAAQQATSDAGNRYPDGSVAKLRAALSLHHDVAPEQIIFGNGSTEVIQGVVAVAARMQATAIEPSPTFGDVRRYAQAEGMEVIQVPVGKGFVTDVAAMQKQCESARGPLLINLCNPNNPTGTSIEHKLLSDWISNAPSDHLFLVDEAYFDYAQANPGYRSVLPQVKQGQPNLVVTRTFSKIYGMAGMRIGYGIAAAELAARIRPFAAGSNLTAAGVAAAGASLADKDFYAKSLQSTAQSKAILIATLDELGLEHIPSDTNFVLHRINAPLAEYSARMLQNGVAVGRKMTTEDRWDRISLGTPAEMREFSDVLKSFRARGWV